MRTLRRRPAAVLVALVATSTLLASAACSSGKGKDAGAQATVPTAPATTTTTAPADPYAIPSDPSKIDADYVNRVLAALNHIRGDLARKQLATGRLEESDLLPLRAMYVDPEFRVQADILVKTVLPARSEIREPLGDPQMTVDHFLTRTPGCLSVVVAYDFSRVLVNPGPPKHPWFVALVRKDPSLDPTNLNPTPWALRYDSNEEADKCVAS